MIIGTGMDEYTSFFVVFWGFFRGEGGGGVCPWGKSHQERISPRLLPNCDGEGGGRGHSRHQSVVSTTVHSECHLSPSVSLPVADLDTLEKL